jgi:hypothetical protein
MTGNPIVVNRRRLISSAAAVSGARVPAKAVDGSFTGCGDY